MICKNCGREVEDGTYMCKHCGVAANIDYKKNISVPEDNAGWGSMLLSFFIPLIGFILYLSWYKTKPMSAKKVIKSALVRIGLNILLAVLSYI